MPIIAILNPKGGAGKTTLTTNLAEALQRRGRSILLVDSDPQGSARDWHAAQEENPLPLVAMDRPNNLAGLKAMAANYDHILIDGAAKLEDMLAAGIKVADLVLIPVQPSPYDIWAASDLVEFIKARQEVTDGQPKARFVITRAVAGTTLGREVDEALAEYALGTLSALTRQRQAYPQSASSGQTVFETNNTDAQAEITAIADEILAILES